METQNILSFDCGIKTLAWVYISTDPKLNLPKFIKNMRVLAMAHGKKKTQDEEKWYIEHIERNNTDLVESVDIKKCDVVNIACDDEDVVAHGKYEYNCMSSVKSLVSYLRSARDCWPVIDKVLIEYQMGQNMQMVKIMTALTTFFTALDIPCVIIAPTIKNKIYFNPACRHETYLAKYADRYRANKKHTEENFNYLAVQYYYDETSHIDAKLMGHVSDAFMQAIAHLATSQDPRCLSD